MPECEFLFVNDGSLDTSLSILKEIAKTDKRVKIISFSRNFGHEAAMIAGIDHATGDGIVCMDADLQHHPRYLKSIVEKFDQGYDVISMVRMQNKGVNPIKRGLSKLFYKCLNAISPIEFQEYSSDFFAVSERTANVLRKEYREKVRYLRGYVQSLGFKKCSIEYDSEGRVAGESKYSLLKLMKLALNAVCNFSDAPLKLGIGAGFISALIGVILLIYTIYQKCVNGAPAGYTTIVIVLCFMFAVLFMLIGILAQYISRIFVEIKDRPIYIVEEIICGETADGSGMEKNIDKEDIQ